MKKLYLVPVLGVIGLALGAPASAQIVGKPDWNNSAYTDERQPYNESRRVAYDNGYREGIKEGERDARQRDVFNYQDERTWQRAEKGYNRSFGDWSRYQQTFRTGYAAGYSDSYRRFAPDNGYRRDDRNGPRGYGNDGVYPGSRGTGYPGQGGYGAGPAYSNGVNDGYEKGRDDARDHRAFDVLRQKWYRSGDHDYKNEYGPKQRYEDTYRQGFKEGYERGYREYRR